MAYNITINQGGNVLTATITQAKSAYQSYLATTADDPVLSEAAWSAPADGAGTVVNNLVSTSTTSSLSAAMGKALEDGKADASAVSNVDNTADADKPVSTAGQTALDLKADAADVSSVDNTADADKPVSTAGQTALDLKADAAAPFWVEVVLVASATAVATGTGVAYLTHTVAGTITDFKLVCDPANEPSAANIEVDMNSVNLSTGALTTRLSAVGTIATSANISTGGTISGTQTVAFGDQSAFDIDQGSDGKELRALIEITPS